jgi:hypothetical protein
LDAVVAEDRGEANLAMLRADPGRVSLDTLLAGLATGAGLVRISDRRGGWITVSPLDAQPEPANLGRLNAVADRWPATSLLDMLKEVDLRLGITDHFETTAIREALDPAVLQRRLLLCLYAYGTNAGIRRVAAGDHTETENDVRYVRRRYLTVANLRRAITEVVNATLAARHQHLWGQATTTASDSTKLGAWDQNLLTEWHARYRGPGVMIYWHVERKSVCIYSQLKSCSSSEVAAMIEGLLRHCSTMAVEATTSTVTVRPRSASRSVICSASVSCPASNGSAPNASTVPSPAPSTVGRP